MSETDGKRKRSRSGAKPSAKRARTAAAAPSRAAIAVRQVRYIDAYGRVYVLPKANDAQFQRLLQQDKVDAENYERELRRGLAFDAATEIRDLTSRVFLYVQLPSPVQQLRLRAVEVDAWRAARATPSMPVPSSELVLRELNSNRLYRATIDTVRFAGARAKSGSVTLSNVRRLINSD